MQLIKLFRRFVISWRGVSREEEANSKLHLYQQTIKLFIRYKNSQQLTCKMDFSGKVALVTGGASGIGLEYVKRFVNNNAKGVTIIDLNETNGRRVASELGEKILYIKTDVTNKVELEDAFKKTIDEFGHLDIVVNNAGILSDEQWELEIAVNSTAVTRGTLLGFKYMGKDKGGNGGLIINTASVAGINIFAAAPIYTATKHFVVALGRSMGTPFFYDLTGVKVLTLCPTFTATPLVKNYQLLSDFAGIVERQRESTQGKFPLQCAERVGEAMVEMIKKGDNGSVWVNLADQEIFEEKCNEPVYA